MRRRQATSQTHISFVEMERKRVELGRDCVKEYGKRRLLDPPTSANPEEFSAFVELEAAYGPTYSQPPKGYEWEDKTHTTIHIPLKKEIKQKISKKVQRAKARRSGKCQNGT